MISFLTIFLVVLISSLINYIAGAGVFVIPTLATSCKNYVHVQYNFASFPLCYIQRINVPIGNSTVPFSCAYWQAYTLVSLNNVASPQSLFPNLNFTGVSTDNVGVAFLTSQNGAQVIVKASAWITTAIGEVNSVDNSTTFIQNEVIVFNSTIGHVRIECPMGTLNNVSQILCSLPNKISVCTYNQNATASDIQSVITGGINFGVNMQSMGIVSQTNCNQTIYQNSPIITIL